MDSTRERVVFFFKSFWRFQHVWGWLATACGGVIYWGLMLYYYYYIYKRNKGGRDAHSTCRRTRPLANWWPCLRVANSRPHPEPHPRCVCCKSPEGRGCEARRLFPSPSQPIKRARGTLAFPLSSLSHSWSVGTSIEWHAQLRARHYHSFHVQGPQQHRLSIL